MRKTILGLVGLNLVLVGYLAVALHQKAAKEPPAISLVNPAETTNGAPNGPVASTASQNSPASAPTITWGSIASRDLRRYAQNLRQIGCPEETIKEIMLAEVNRVYGLQERALRVRPDDVAPWETAALYDRRQNETKLRQLLEDKRNLLKELTGVDVGIDMPSRLAGRDLEKFEAGFAAMPDSKRDQVRAIQENYWAQSDDIKQRTVGYLEPEDRDEFLRIKTERREALAKVLTPRELQDYEIKTSDAAPALRTRLEGLNLTDDEFRNVFDFMQPLDEKYSLSRRNPDPLDQEFTAARTKAEKDLEEQIRTVVGDERFAEYQRARDPAYRTISQIGAEVGAPKESILQAYQAQQQMQNESKRIMGDASLTPEQRLESLQGLQAQAQQTLGEVFGDKAAQVLQRLPNVRLAERYGLPGNRVQTVIPNSGTDHVIPGTPP